MDNSDVDLQSVQALINPEAVKPGLNVAAIDAELKGIKISQPAVVDIMAEFEQFSKFADSIVGTTSQPTSALPQSNMSTQSPGALSQPGQFVTSQPQPFYPQPPAAAVAPFTYPSAIPPSPQNNAVLSAFEGNSAAIKDMEEDEIYMLLDEIDNYRSVLDSMKVPHTFIPVVTKNNTLSEIKDVRARLRVKHDRVSCQGMSKEILLMAAGFLEYMFDGETKIGGFAPNLTGYSTIMNMRLNKISHLTGTAMARVLHNADSPWLRIAMELGPSMVTCHMNNASKEKGSVSRRDRADASNVLGK